MTTASMGTLALASINGTSVEFSSCSIGKTSSILLRNGIKGSRSNNALDARIGPYSVGGSIVMEPSAADLYSLMVLAIGANGAAADALTSFTTIVNRVAATETYSDCVVDSATLRGSQGGIVELSLEIVGKTANTTGSVAAPTIAVPFIMSDVTLTLGNTAYETMSFELVVNNNVARDRFANSLTLTDIPPGMRLVTLQTAHAYNSNSSALFETTLTTPASPNTLVLNNGTNSVTFTFGALQAPREDPPIDGTEIMLTKNWVSRKTGNTNEIAVALT